MNKIDIKNIEQQLVAGMRAYTATVRSQISAAAVALADLRVRLHRAYFGPTDECPAPFANIMVLLAHLCDFDRELRFWVLRWMAYQLRNPGAKMSTALIFNGGRQSGKRLFLKYVVAQLFAEDTPLIRAHQLHNVFNDWASEGGLVLVEGPVSHRHLERMKAYMAGSSLAIESRGRESRTIPNSLNFIYLSHAKDFLPMDLYCKRLVVIDVPPARDKEFYHAVLNEIANGGVASFRHYLLHGLDMGNFNPSTPAPAPELRKVQEAA